jgi:hypothetical protein
MTEAASTSVPEDSNLHIRRRENLKSHPKGRNHVDDLGIDVRIILKWLSKK